LWQALAGLPGRKMVHWSVRPIAGGRSRRLAAQARPKERLQRKGGRVRGLRRTRSRRYHAAWLEVSFMRSVRFFLILGVFTAAPARAEPLQIHGTTGYAGEYELSSSVSEQDLNGKKIFSGPLTVKHVGLCTHDGPKETVGEIRFELAKSFSRIIATLDFDGNKCIYNGVFSESYHGLMDCGRGGSVPLRIWAK
jgi:hypothetical protein